MSEETDIPIGTKTLILSKLYYGILSKNLENIDTERYFAILYFIRNNNGCCQQDICDRMYIRKTAMVKILDTLTKGGFIERKTKPEDLRHRYVFLSRKGEKQTREIARTFAAIDAQLFSNITEKEKASFNSTLAKLTKNLEKIPKDNLLFNYKKTKQA